MGLAFELDRIFLQEHGWTWRYRNRHCEEQNIKSWECYFEPFSKCTLKDAIISMVKSEKKQHSKHTANTVKDKMTMSEWTPEEDT